MASGGSAVEVDYDLPEDAPSYMSVAVEHLGTKEYITRGGRKVCNPTVEEYSLVAIGKKMNAIKVPWCAYFVNYCLVKEGFPGTRSGMARSFLTYGEEVAQPNWQCGDVVVMWRGKYDDGVTGHVALFLYIKGKRIYCLGGNHADSVSIQSFALNKVLSVRRPRGISKSKTIRATAGAGINEVAAKPLAQAVLPDPSIVTEQAEQIKGPLEALAASKPWLLALLSFLTVACLCYAAYYRWQDYKSGKNS